MQVFGWLQSQEPETRVEHSLHVGRYSFRPGTELRKFVSIPEVATWAELRLVAGDHDAVR